MRKPMPLTQPRSKEAHELLADDVIAGGVVLSVTPSESGKTIVIELEDEHGGVVRQRRRRDTVLSVTAIAPDVAASAAPESPKNEPSDVDPSTDMPTAPAAPRAPATPNEAIGRDDVRSLEALAIRHAAIRKDDDATAPPGRSAPGDGGAAIRSKLRTQPRPHVSRDESLFARIWRRLEAALLP